jgi:hypothetical protein
MSAFATEGRAQTEAKRPPALIEAKSNAARDRSTRLTEVRPLLRLGGKPAANFHLTVQPSLEVMQE